MTKSVWSIFSTDHYINVSWIVDILIFTSGFPEIRRLFQGFFCVVKVEKRRCSASNLERERETFASAAPVQPKPAYWLQVTFLINIIA